MTDLVQPTGQCNACKGAMYYDGLNWRHVENDRGLRECPGSSVKNRFEEIDQMLFDAGVLVLSAKTNAARTAADHKITEARVRLESLRARLS